MINKEQFARDFIALFPQYQADYEEHLQDYSEILGHVFFGNLINQPLSELLRKNIEEQIIQKYIDFIERMYSYGDDDVKNIVEVTILEYLGDDNAVLKNAFNYFSDDLIAASKRVEALLGRRDIIVSHKKGKTFTRW